MKMAEARIREYLSEPELFEGGDMPEEFKKTVNAINDYIREIIL